MSLPTIESRDLHNLDDFPAPDDGLVDTRTGWWARRNVVARGWVGGGWALVGARPHDTPLDAWLPANCQGQRKALAVALVSPPMVHWRKHEKK